MEIRKGPIRALRRRGPMRGFRDQRRREGHDGLDFRQRAEQKRQHYRVMRTEVSGTKPRTPLDPVAKAGRPTSLTPEVYEKVIQYIKAGNYTYVSAGACGIAEPTFWKWMREGQAEIDRRMEENPDFDPVAERDSLSLVCQFMIDVKKAELESEVVIAAMIRAQVPENWTAGMTFLERRFKKRWMRGETLEHTGPDGGPIQSAKTVKLEFDKLNAEQLQAIRRALLVAKGEANGSADVQTMRSSALGAESRILDGEYTVEKGSESEK